MDYGYEVADAIMEYYDITSNHRDNAEDAKAVLEELYSMAKDKFLKRAIDKCTEYIEEEGGVAWM